MVKLERIDHIAIAVEDLDASLVTFESLFGTKPSHREKVEGFGVDIATLSVGGTDIELLQANREDSPIRKFIEKRGPGIHHIAFVVDDVTATLAELEAQGVELIDRAPRRGKGGSLVAFVHPRSTQKVLYELVQLPTQE